MIEDFNAAAAVASQLRRLLGTAASMSGAGEFIGEARALYLSLKDVWEMSGTTLDLYKEVDDAAAFLDVFLSPLLDPDRFDLEVRTAEIFLRRYPGGTALASQSPGDPLYVDFALRSFTPTFAELDSALSESLPSTLALRLVNLVTGVTVLCSVPIWTIYHHFHGTAAHSVVAQQLAAVLATARSSVRATHAELVRQVSGDGGNLSPNQEYMVATTVDGLNSMISTRLEYLAQFVRDISHVPRRFRIPVDVLDKRIRQTAFWVSGPPDKRQVTKGRPENAGAEAEVLASPGTVIYDGGERLQARSFYALPEAWETLQNFCRLVCQAGFTVIVTACANSHGGRHPPHVTHREGMEFDLDWSFTSDPRDRVRNLARRRKRYGAGIFRDLERGQYFSLEEIPGDTRPPTHIYLEALSALVVFQAAALSGLRRYLYVDVENMILAADYLGWVVDRAFFAEVGRRANIPVAEGLSHFNHLHGELPLSASSRMDETVLTQLLRQAVIRDGDPEFSSYYLRAPVYSSPPSTPREREEREGGKARAKQFADLWAERASRGLPALLPAWLPAEEQRRRLFGE